MVVREVEHGEAREALADREQLGDGGVGEIAVGEAEVLEARGGRRHGDPLEPRARVGGVAHDERRHGRDARERAVGWAVEAVDAIELQAREGRRRDPREVRERARVVAAHRDREAREARVRDRRRHRERVGRHRELDEARQREQAADVARLERASLDGHAEHELREARVARSRDRADRRRRVHMRVEHELAEELRRRVREQRREPRVAVALGRVEAADARRGDEAEPPVEREVALAPERLGEQRGGVLAHQLLLGGRRLALGRGIAVGGGARATGLREDHVAARIALLQQPIRVDDERAGIVEAGGELRLEIEVDGGRRPAGRARAHERLALGLGRRIVRADRHEQLIGERDLERALLAVGEHHAALTAALLEHDAEAPRRHLGVADEHAPEGYYDSASWSMIARTSASTSCACTAGSASSLPSIG